MSIKSIELNWEWGNAFTFSKGLVKIYFHRERGTGKATGKHTQVRRKWHPILYIVQHLWGLWSKTAHYVGNRVPFGTQEHRLLFCSEWINQVFEKRSEKKVHKVKKQLLSLSTQIKTQKWSRQRAFWKWRVSGTPWLFKHCVCVPNGSLFPTFDQD